MTRIGVLVADYGTDAALVAPVGAEPLLVLRPGQTFGSAVAAASAVLPLLPGDQVRALIRQHMPDAPRFEIPVAGTFRYDYPTRFLPNVVWWLLTLTAALALVGFVGIHQSSVATVIRFQQQPYGDYQAPLIHGGTPFVQQRGAPGAGIDLTDDPALADPTPAPPSAGLE